MISFDLTLPLDRFVLRARALLGAAAAVLGPSGAGKTALLESIAGLRPARGRLEVEGVLLQDTDAGLRLPPERRRLGYVPQEGALFPHLSVRSNLLFGRRPRGAAGRAAGGEGGGVHRKAPWGVGGGADRDVDRVVAALELGPLLERSPRHLSGGERRRVALGRALLARPRLLLLDEPTAGLDPLRARRALARVRQVHRELGVPLLVVTHRPEEAAALAGEVLVLDDGEVRDRGPVREVLARHARGAGADAETLVEARVEAHRQADGVTRVQLGEAAGGTGSMSVPYTPDLAVGSEVLLAVGADEVLVATARPAGLSARNAVEVEVDAVEPAEAAGGALLVRAGPWLAHLTPEAVRELALERGVRVWMVVKTHSWRVVA